MKYKLALVMSAFCAFSVWTEAKVKLPAILSDGMVLQRERSVKIWGNADKGESVTVVFKKKKFSTVAGEDGKWLVELPPMKAGGPFEMIVNDIRLKNILVGDVWLCSGQSNMELTVGRVTDKFAEEIARDENPMIRYVKIPLGNDLHGPKDDLPGTDWMSLTEETAPSFSALAYFFAKEMYRETQVPVGIVNSSWGGSSVEAWMSEEALQKFPRQLHERDLFNSDEYRELCNRSGQMMNRFWDAALYKGDQGLHDGICWNRPELDDTDWQTVDTFSKEWGRKNGYPVSGSHWFRQKVNVSAEQAGKDAVLRDDGSDDVGQHFLEDDEEAACAQRAGGQNELLILQLEHLSAGDPAHAHPLGEHQGKDDGHHAGLQHQKQQRDDDQTGDAVGDLEEALHQHIHLAAEIARDKAVAHADDHINDRSGHGDDEGDAGTFPSTGPDVAAVQIGRASCRERV